jgi:hypothetical protein
MPWWVGLVVLAPALLFGLAFLFMPFSVFGLKGRLESVEARLDEIQGEIRSLALRLPERPGDRGFVERPHIERDVVERVDRRERDLRLAEPPPRRWAEEARPPIPPAPYPREVQDRPPPPPTRRVDPSRGSRAEPRLDPR